MDSVGLPAFAFVPDPRNLSRWFSIRADGTLVQTLPLSFRDVVAATGVAAGPAAGILTLTVRATGALGLSATGGYGVPCSQQMLRR